jgi:hypothetical protein
MSNIRNVENDCVYRIFGLFSFMSKDSKVTGDNFTLTIAFFMATHNTEHKYRFSYIVQRIPLYITRSVTEPESAELVDK